MGEQVPVPPVLTACDEAQGKVAAVERALAVEIYAQNNTGIIPALRRKVDIAKGEMQRVCLQVVLDKYGDKKWNKSGEIHGDLANKTVEHPEQEQQPEPDPPADASATINMDFAYVSSIRDKFDAAFSEDVAAVLGVTEFDVLVKTVLPGSVIVNFQVPTAESVETLAFAKITTAKLSAVNKDGAPVTISGIQLVANQTANNTKSSSRVFVKEANAATISKADRISKRLGNASDNNLNFVKQVRELQEEKENATVTKAVSRENVTAKRETAEKANSTRKAFQIEPDGVKEAPEQRSNITTKRPESSAERKLKAPLDRKPNMTTVEKKDAAAKAPVGTVPPSNKTRTPQKKSSNTSATSS